MRNLDLRGMGNVYEVTLTSEWELLVFGQSGHRHFAPNTSAMQHSAVIAKGLELNDCFRGI